MIMPVSQDIALNELEDAYYAFLNEFVPDMPDYSIAMHIMNELRNNSYDDVTDLAHRFMQQYSGDQWSQLIYEFFHSEGIHRTKLDDLLEVYWEFMDSLEDDDQDQNQNQEIPVG